MIAPHVGGSFGAKHLSAEGVVAVKVALELGRPVKWVETRSENMVAMPHGRGPGAVRRAGPQAATAPSSGCAAG